MTLIRKNHGRNHSYYDQLSADQRVKIPGVTSLLSDGMPKPALVNWAAEQAAQFAITNWATLGKLGILERARKIQYAHRDYTAAAAARGTEIHGYAERLIHDEPVEIPDAVAGYVDACVEFLNTYDVDPAATETAVVNRTLNYAGTLDLVADITTAAGRQRWLLDWKTGKGIYPDAALQLSAYQHAEHYACDDDDVDGEGWHEHPMADLGIQRAGVVHLRSDGYDVYPLDTGDQTFLLFRHIAYVGRWLHWDKDTGALIDAFKGNALDPHTIGATA